MGFSTEEFFSKQIVLHIIYISAYLLYEYKRILKKYDDCLEYIILNAYFLKLYFSKVIVKDSSKTVAH